LAVFFLRRGAFFRFRLCCPEGPLQLQLQQQPVCSAICRSNAASLTAILSSAKYDPGFGPKAQLAVVQLAVVLHVVLFLRNPVGQLFSGLLAHRLVLIEKLPE